MALAATPTWEVTATVADRDKNMRTFSFNVPNGLTYAEAYAAALVVINAAKALINGVVVRVNLLGGYYEDTYPATLPAEASDVERKAVFVFNTDTPPAKVKVELPSVNNTFVVDGSNSLDPANATVAAFIAAMIDTGIGAGNSPVSGLGADITGLFGGVRKIHRKSAKG